MQTTENRHASRRPIGMFWFYLMSALVGVVAGLGAVVFRGLIALLHNLMFLGKWSWAYDANKHTAVSPWGFWVILVPVVGAVGVVFLVKTFAPEAKGHGVPEVMDAIYNQRGRIRPVVAVIKSLASALSIGSGGSVGREGPIIQIGSSFGSTLGQLLRVPVWQRIALIAGGAGGGIAATFNTPIGGVLFVVEIMMLEVSVRTLVPVAIAVATATYIGQLFFGPHPSFVIPALETSYFQETKPLALLAYVVLGILMGLVAVLFIRAIYGTEDFFTDRVPGGYYVQHLLGMLAVGITIYGCMIFGGHYYVQGVGYATVQDLLSSMKYPLYVIIVLFGLKLLSTSLTLGSGASGGIFSPALFLGATFGAAYGILLNHIFPQLKIVPSAFAVAGMAGLVGSSTGAAMAAIVMIFEMTLDYSVIVPMTITVAISYGVRKYFSRESIYTMKLARRGHFLPESLRTDPHSVRRSGELACRDVGFVDGAVTLDQFADQVGQNPATPFFLVETDHRITGFVRNSVVTRFLAPHEKNVRLRDLADHHFIKVNEQTSLFDVVAAMQANSATVAVVMTTTADSSADRNVKGIISRQELGNAMVEAEELFRD